jgi:hypothetical protein
MPVWARYGIVAGMLAFATTLAADLSVLWLGPRDLCRAGPPILLVISALALLVFVLLAAAAGFATGHASGVVSQAVLAGLLVGAIGGCALVVTVPFISGATQRAQELSVACPQAQAFARSFFFSIGPTPPPGFAGATPPPAFFGETPPPGLFSPPPGSYGSLPPSAMAPPSGIAGALLDTVGLMFRIGFGTGLAAGTAGAAGALGAAIRPRAA